jgi:hypothetical protein
MLYELHNEKEFFVNNLEDIGLIDPYSFESEGQTVIDYSEYLESTRMIEGQRPMMVYIPNRKIIFNLIRSCINVKNANSFN